jgi:formyl-CoA transferase
MPNRDDTGRGPLDGVRIVELASFIAAPLAGAMLADLGAEVIKVEPPRGDPMRRLGRHPSGTSPMWINSNRGKHGRVMDLKDSAAQAELHELLATADLMLCNWRQPVAERLGLRDDDLAQRHPRLIRLWVSGFGSDGPLADSPVFDTIIQARLGLTEANGDGETPGLESSFSVDKMSAMLVCQAALAALFARERHGAADRVDVAMFDAAAYANFADVMVNRTLVRHEPPSARNLHPGAVRPLPTADGWIVVVPVTADQVRRTLEAVGRADLIDTVMAPTDGVELTRTLFRELESILRSRPTADWLEALARHDVPAAPCLTIDQHLQDAQTVNNELYDVREWPEWHDVGPMRHVRHPALFSTWGKARPRVGPPALPPR